jgi:hypothetical protein
MLVEIDVTQDLPQDITIRDSEGNKMKQLVEYEWKPLFCNKCQKMGHVCAKEPPKKVQPSWKPKATAAPMTKPTPAPTMTTISVDEGNTWTMVQSNGKLKGKGAQQSFTNVSCSNGFEPLGTLNGPLVLQDTGQ